MLWVVQYDYEGKVVCELCWLSFNKLWVHIRNSHDMLTKDYRKQCWLDMKTRLMSEASIELARRRNKENFDLVVKDNLLNLWVSTRYKDWHKWRTKESVSIQSFNRLKNLYKDCPQNILHKYNIDARENSQTADKVQSEQEDTLQIDSTGTET